MTDIRKGVSRWGTPMALTLFAFVLFRAILFVGYVPTSSMEPTLEAGSYIMGSRISKDLNNGDIVVFHHDGQLLVKRIAACPGDEIDLREIAYMKTIAIPVWEDPILTVPENCYFMLGDNVENSIDSRYWTDPFIQSSDIVAKLFIR
jgi:signal peptidase I